MFVQLIGLNRKKELFLNELKIKKIVCKLPVIILN